MINYPGLLKIRPDLLLLQPKASRPVFHFLLTGLEIFDHKYPILYIFYDKFIVEEESYRTTCKLPNRVYAVATTAFWCAPSGQLRGAKLLPDLT